MASISKHNKELYRIQFQCHNEKRKVVYVENVGQEKVTFIFNKIQELVSIRNNCGLTEPPIELSDWVESIKESSLYAKLVKSGLIDDKEKKNEIEKGRCFISIANINKITSVLKTFHSRLFLDDYPFMLNDLEYENFMAVLDIMECIKNKNNCVKKEVLNAS